MIGTGNGLRLWRVTAHERSSPTECAPKSTAKARSLRGVSSELFFGRSRLRLVALQAGETE